MIRLPARKHLFALAALVALAAIDVSPALAADAIVKLPDDTSNPGQKVDHTSKTVGTNAVLDQRINVCDPTANACTPVDPTNGISVNLGAAGGVAVAATAKGTQGTNFLPTQDAKDSGRTYVTLCADRVVTATSEGFVTFTVNRGGTATTLQTVYSVTTGKTFRLTALHVEIYNTTTVANKTTVRVRAAGSVTTSSPIVAMGFAAAPIAAATNGWAADASIPDGVEIAAGQQVGISHIENVTTAQMSACAIGFEY